MINLYVTYTTEFPLGGPDSLPVWSPGDRGTTV